MKTEQATDNYDDAAWTEMDVEDLKAAIEQGDTIEDAAEFLCRSGSIDEGERCASWGSNRRGEYCSGSGAIVTPAWMLTCARLPGSAARHAGSQTARTIKATANGAAATRYGREA
jgi:hypothetical protein